MPTEPGNAYFKKDRKFTSSIQTKVKFNPSLPSVFHWESYDQTNADDIRSDMSLFTYLRGVVAAAHGGSGCERLRPYPTTQDTTVRERTVESGALHTDLV